jgi:hypothetical protein
MALDTEIAAFESRREELEKYHSGKYVVFYGDEMVGAFDTFDAAAREAISRFGRGPYLIRQVGAPPVAMPASVMYRPVADVANR